MKDKCRVVFYDKTGKKKAVATIKIDQEDMMTVKLNFIPEISDNNRELYGFLAMSLIESLQK